MSPKATRAVQEAARRIVRERDGMLCQMCGRYGQHNTHHRINKGGGGSALFDRASLLIKACGSGTTGCHGRVTGNPEWAGDIGWLLPRNNPDIVPEFEPILLFDGWHLLDDHGNRAPCSPPNRHPYTGEGAA